MAKRPVKQSRKKPTSKEVKALCAHIEELRKQQGLSIRKFADACDISLSQAVEIGSKGIDIRFSTLVKLAQGLKLPITELLNF
jgi:transcriptional regulator with XRE-family HTH domain